MPPLALGYTRSPLERPGCERFTPIDVAPESLANLPGGVDGETYRWLDLDGEGIAGVVATQGGAWFYKSNLGDGRGNNGQSGPARGGLPVQRQRVCDQRLRQPKFLYSRRRLVVHHPERHGIYRLHLVDELKFR